MQYLAFKKGETQGEIEIIGETDHTGTIINFKPDPEIFTETIEFDYDILKKRLRELAFLNRQLTITLEDKREENKKDTFYYEGGIISYVEYINRTKDVLHERHFPELQQKDVYVENLFLYNDVLHRKLYSIDNKNNTFYDVTYVTCFL